MRNQYEILAGAVWNGEQALQNHAYVIPKGCNLKRRLHFGMGAQTFVGRGWLVVPQGAETMLSDEQVKTDARVVKSGSDLDESLQLADDQGSAATPMNDDEGGSEESSMEG